MCNVQPVAISNPDEDSSEELHQRFGCGTFLCGACVLTLCCSGFLPQPKRMHYKLIGHSSLSKCLFHEMLLHCGPLKFHNSVSLYIIEMIYTALLCAGICQGLVPTLKQTRPDPMTSKDIRPFRKCMMKVLSTMKVLALPFQMYV